ncbi:MAG: thioredoxin family protein [Verrucomicrobia bacterium]|nr:thioredoxin family protein [Verrucomicrobiota bacterium]
MKNVLRSIVLFVALVGAPAVCAASNINWYTNFDQAQGIAKSQSKPMLLLFTGSDWCGWCMKLEKEIFDTSQFQQIAGNDFIFVKVDFPMHSTQSAAEKKQNETLRDRFGVNGFPTVILLTSSGEKLGETGYQKESPQLYADRLKGMIGAAMRLEGSLEGLAADQLQERYLEAMNLGRQNIAEQVMAKGLTLGSGSFFLAERYRELVQGGQGGGVEASQVRDELLKRDADNREGRHLFVAVLDFQEKVEKGSTIAEAVHPLMAYLEGAGKDDLNRWRVELTLAQFLRSRGEEKEAVNFAERSYASAPQESKETLRQLLNSFGIS